MKLKLGDCLEVLKKLEDNSVDAVVTDPPYGWRFMGKAWDGEDIEKTLQRDRTMATDNKTTLGMAAGKYDPSLAASHSFQLWTQLWAKEAFRVLKPGGHMLVFCGPRTYHRMASGVEDAGFEIRDQLQWLFGSGFPKSLNIGKAVKEFEGWGTALKPANEPIVLARKPLSEKTVAANVLKWGTGGLNIDASRIETDWANDPNKRGYQGTNYIGGSPFAKGIHNDTKAIKREMPSQGRFPANLLLDETAAEMLDEQIGQLVGAGNKKNRIAGEGKNSASIFGTEGGPPTILYDRGGSPSRFFYVAKASKRERNQGLDTDPQTTERMNNHPTVKPIKLMEYLCRLITPPNGIILDPFMGSGTTGLAAKRLGFQFIGVEREGEYFDLAKARLG